jgi:hypothetical protein
MKYLITSKNGGQASLFLVGEISNNVGKKKLIAYSLHFGKKNYQISKRNCHISTWI